MDRGHPLHDLSCLLKTACGYDFTDLRSRLHGKLHIGFVPEWVLFHLEFCFKKSKSTVVYIKIINSGPEGLVR